MNGINDSSRPKIGDYLLVRLDASYSDYTRKLIESRLAYSDDAVHDFRVASRRLRTLVSLIDSLCPSEQATEMTGSIRRRLKMFGPLRDVQVQMNTIKNMLWDFPQLEVYYDELNRLEDQMKRELREKMSTFDTAEFDGIIFEMKQSAAFDRGGLDSAADKLNESLDAARRKVELRIESARADRPESIHSVRLAFKKFRYLTEHVAKLINFGSNEYEFLKKFQTIMGEIQDNIVLRKSLEDYADSREAEAITRLPQIVKLLEKDYEEKAGQFENIARQFRELPPPILKL